MDAEIDIFDFSNPYDPLSLENITFPAIQLANRSDWEALKTVEVDVGRRYQPIFPNIEINVLNLRPDKSYTLSLRIEKVDNWLYKRSPEGVWYQYQYDREQKQLEERPRSIMHPDGIRTGEYWMSKPITFGAVGVTNDPDTIRRENTKDRSQRRNMFVVQHRHKYRIILGVNNGMGADAFETQECYNPSCEFIAVSERSKEYAKKVKEFLKMKEDENGSETAKEKLQKRKTDEKEKKIKKMKKN